MLRLLLGHDQVVFKGRWSLNAGGHKDRFHCTKYGFSVIFFGAECFCNDPYLYCMIKI